MGIYAARAPGVFTGWLPMLAIALYLVAGITGMLLLLVLGSLDRWLCARLVTAVTPVCYCSLAVGCRYAVYRLKIYELMQEGCISIANALELSISCTNPSRYVHKYLMFVLSSMRIYYLYDLFTHILQSCNCLIVPVPVKDMVKIDQLLLIHQWPLLLTWFNFNPSMDK